MPHCVSEGPRHYVISASSFPLMVFPLIFITSQFTIANMRIDKKAAQAAYMRKWLKTPQAIAYRILHRKEHAAYNRKWSAQNNEKRRKINRASYAKHRKKRLSYSAEYKARNPLKAKAQWQVYWAIKKGVLLRPPICSECGLKRTIQAHHHKGYKEESWLDVIWLCIPCHRQSHKRN